MADKTPPSSTAAGRPAAEREKPPVPKPPSRKGVEQISREQALITDEWTGEGPSTSQEDGQRPSPPHDRQRPAG